MTRERAFGWVAAGILGTWAVHNAVLLPIETARISEAVREPALIGLRAVVWLGPIGWFLRRYEPDPLQSLALTTRPRRILLALAPAMVYGALIAAVRGPPTHLPALAGLPVLIAGATLEEVLMRGFLYGELARSIRPGWAVIATAGLFAAMHVPGWLALGTPAEEVVPSVVVIGLLGVVLGIARAVSGSLWPAIALHVANNLYAASV